MEQVQDTYKAVRVFEYPNAIVRVYIPDLDEKERARRRKRLHDAAARILKEQERGVKHGDIHGIGINDDPDRCGGHC